jgi:hypothetical protein
VSAAFEYIAFLAAAGESELGPSCPACGYDRLEYLQGYFETGVTGPNGEPEMYWREAVRCRNCGEIEEL